MQAFLTHPPLPNPPKLSKRPTNHPKCVNLRPLLPAIATTILFTNSQILPNLPAALAEQQPQTQPPVQTESTTVYFPIQDPARVLTTGQSTRLSTRLQTLYTETGLRIQIITRGPTLTTLPKPDPTTIIIAVDPRAGNILSFSVGSQVSQTLPTAFFIEASNRFGNAFYIRDNGPDKAVFAVVSAIEQCVKSGKVCRAVPGVSDDQWRISFVSACIAGCIAGAAARTGGERFNSRFFVLFSPLWGIFLVSFGLGPIVTRGGIGWELVSTAAAFLIFGGGVWGWIPRRFGPPGSDAEG